jgi:hypothetical protein
MGKYGGAVKIDEVMDKELSDYWRQTDLWPISQELEPAAKGPANDAWLFSNICPEVIYDRFGYFASYLSDYAAEIDRDAAHKMLSKYKASHDDWRWMWSTLVPEHYSVFSMYSQLLAGMKELNQSSPNKIIGF